MTLTEHFGSLPDGRPVTAHTLAAADGPQLRVLDLGATVQSLRLSDEPSGPGASIVLGLGDPAAYLSEPHGYHGAVVGRYANRIAGSTFTLDGQSYAVTPNEGPHCLHGGVEGFDRRLWTVTGLSETDITLELVSPDGDQGFPGELTATVRYSVEPDRVGIELTARTDAPTVVSLANHAYFNLAGEGSGSIDGHLLTVDADSYLPVDGAGIPLPQAAGVAGTPLDLRAPARVGDRICEPHVQVGAVGGIDHAFTIRGAGLRRAARLEDPSSGRWLEVHTDQPALQVYTGNFLDGGVIGATGRRYRQGDGIALETQRHPDAPNRAWLPSPVLRPGETYRSFTQWRLGQGPSPDAGHSVART
jgi:aldose 1-epimerase